MVALIPTAGINIHILSHLGPVLPNHLLARQVASQRNAMGSLILKKWCDADVSEAHRIMTAV